MAVQPADDPARALARRLRALREREWPGVTITQRQLAQALSDDKPVSIPLISSWERVDRPTIPPADRLVAYATFFATRRSVDQVPFRLLDAEELTDPERARRDELRRELLAARDRAGQHGGAPAGRAIAPLGGPWQFADEMPVTMVCAELPAEQRRHLPKPGDPEGGYAELYALADLDALFELHGHIRAANPSSLVVVRTSSALRPDDYTTHLVVLGGVDWNLATRNLLRRLPDVPVEQSSGGPGGPGGSHFTVTGGAGERRRLHAELAADGSLVADVGHFFRAPNPYDHQRTVTICNGISSRGVLGAVRALTDARFRDRNTAYLQDRFGGAEAFSVLMRVPIVDDAVVTPDWTQADTRLHEWPGGGS